MGIFDNLMLKRIPQFNVFESHPTIKSSFGIGTWNPIFYRNLVPGERARVKLSQLTRFSPLVAPVMDNYDLTFAAFEVPKRVIDHTFGTNLVKFFNPVTDDDSRGSLPSMTLGEIYSRSGGNITGKLPDWFGYPSLNALLDTVYNEITAAAYPSLFNWAAQDFVEFQYQWLFQKRQYSISGSYATIASWLYRTFGFTATSTVFTPDAISEYLGIPVPSLIKRYVDEVFFTDIITKMATAIDRSSFSENVNILPFLAYWQVVADWFTNPNIDGDAEEFVFNSGIFEDDIVSHGLTTKGLTPFRRYWANDRFTSAFPNAMYSSSQVAIPVGGTITDLRQSFIIDGFKQTKLYSGKRYIDAIMSYFGVKSSNALLDRSSVIGKIDTTLSIDALSQANQADINSALESPIGTLIGQGTSVNNTEYFFDFTAEEHTAIIIMECVRPRASYYQGIDRENLKLDFYDFLLPNFDKIGEQPVYNAELYFDKNGNEYNADQPSIFGFNRRYYEYMDCPSSVHGEFRTSLDYWHSARKFNNQPTLSANFLQVHPEYDYLNRVFATDLSDPIRQIVRLDIEMLSPIQKTVIYDL